ncbi:MAG: hypothetical protein NVS9B12_00970 [Vulcanimicrobiaceae bacterium]
MLPLDLTKAPPRSPWEKLDGLVLMPRSLDKLRAQLPGGAPGGYLTHLGVTKVLFAIVRVEEASLLGAVAAANDENEVAAWLRQHADTERYEKANRLLTGLTVDDVPTDLADTFESFYAGRDPSVRNLFDLLEWDDRRSFAR